VGPIETVKRYRNELGQLLEHSPYCERDIRTPQELVADDQPGKYLVKVRKGGYLHQYYYDFSPLDVVGGMASCTPTAFLFTISSPYRSHSPAPHQCTKPSRLTTSSFAPSYPASSITTRWRYQRPYNHSNIDSDEVLYYAEGNFMSRRGIERGSFTLHLVDYPTVRTLAPPKPA
jgi:homogentisate 1,2-dioxygenase